MAERISVTRALAEIKSLTGRIETALAESTFVAVTKGKGERRTVNNSARPVQVVENELKSAFQRIGDLMQRRRTLKKGVMLSNAMTMVNIGGCDITVAEAIERKASLALHTALYTRLRNQYAAANTTVITGNEKLNQQIEAAVIAAYGSDAKSAPSAEAYAGVADPRRRDHELSLLDPCDIASQINKQAEYINSFNTEVDYVLSESNAIATITLD